MSLVILETPYSPANGKTIKENLYYARACLLDCLQRGEYPIASHLLYTQVLDDAVPEQRELGIKAGFAWHGKADKIVFYLDHGMSQGMIKSLDHYNKWPLKDDRPVIESRYLSKKMELYPLSVV